MNINNINPYISNEIKNNQNTKSEIIIEKEVTNKELSKVEQIKLETENGTYKVDLDKIAEKMADELIK